jgi:predicted methyltransferase
MPESFRKPSRRAFVGAVGALGAVACSPVPAEKATAPAGVAGPRIGSLEWAVGGPWRSAADKARDPWRHPIETLGFFELRAGQTVVEFWPGAGWWTEILAPWLDRNGGTYVAALFPTDAGADAAAVQIVERFRERFSERALYGEPRISAFGPATGPVAPAGSADLVMFMRNLHNWMAAGIAEKAFRDAFAALKPGGLLGIEQHRANVGGVQDPAATNGYVQEPYVKQLAAEAGFAFVGSSEINANPEDTKDHPFGVWTLPPQRLTAPQGQPADPAFDRAKYDRIGESDRMTLKFRKPAT